MTSAVITYYKHCSCDEHLSLWQYNIEDSEKSVVDSVDDLGFSKMCCRMRILTAPMPFVIDYMADMRVFEKKNGNMVRERGYVVTSDVPLP